MGVLHLLDNSLICTICPLWIVILNTVHYCDRLTICIITTLSLPSADWICIKWNTKSDFEHKLFQEKYLRYQSTFILLHPTFQPPKLSTLFLQLGTALVALQINCISLILILFQGADFVEFDVVLTKDKVPVIYHDFSVCIAPNTVCYFTVETELLILALPAKGQIGLCRGVSSLAIVIGH